MRLWGIAPRKFLKFNLQICAFDAFLRLSQTLNLMQNLLILEVKAADGGARAPSALYGSYAHVFLVNI